MERALDAIRAIAEHSSLALLGPTLAAVSDKEDGEDLSFNLAYGANQTRLRLKRGL
jgi:hypothetical protein